MKNHPPRHRPFPVQLALLSVILLQLLIYSDLLLSSPVHCKPLSFSGDGEEEHHHFGNGSRYSNGDENDDDDGDHRHNSRKQQ